MISLKRYITSDGKYPAFQEQWVSASHVVELEQNARKLLAPVSNLITMAGLKVEDIVITSGWRPAAHNYAIGGSAKSHHVMAKAIDIWDPDKVLGEFCEANQDELRHLRLYMECLSVTHKAMNRAKRWVHLQTVPPKSGRIIFIP